mgnify:CR=1 FL=1
MDMQSLARDTLPAVRLLHGLPSLLALTVQVAMAIVVVTSQCH